MVFYNATNPINMGNLGITWCFVHLEKVFALLGKVFVVVEVNHSSPIIEVSTGIISIRYRCCVLLLCVE